MIGSTGPGTGAGRRPGLLGREAECEQFERLLAAVRAGESRSLVVRGEAGVGKSALLEHLTKAASDCRVVGAAGVQSEMELAFAAVHQLCVPLLNRLNDLPAPQRDALGTAFGMHAGSAPDHFLVGLGVLSLLAAAAEDRPLVCVIDDAQWLDRASAQVLAFVARRLFAESVACVFAVRDLGEQDELAGLPVMDVAGLRDDDARALLGTVVLGRLDEQLRDQILGEARGNPLALLELPRELPSLKLAGGFVAPAARTLSGRIEKTFQRRLERLPAPTRRLLLLAAAEPLGDPVLLWRAADVLGDGVGIAAADAAEDMIDVGDRVRFRHPLVRSAVYRAASPEQRRKVHLALAEATDTGTDPDRHAWHRAHGTAQPDEPTAAELERSAERAQARGGLAAAAAFLERAAALTPDPGRRAERALAASRMTHQAGSPDTALKLLSIAAAGPLDDHRHGELEVLRAQIAFTVGRGSEGAGLLLKAARRLESSDVPLARETYLEAINAAILAGSLAPGGGQLEAALAARAVSPLPHASRAADLLLDGTVLRITEGQAACVSTLKAAMDAFRAPDLSNDEGLPWLWLASITAVGLWDYETWSLLSARHLRIARETGRITNLPLALSSRIADRVLGGELAEAAALGEELTAISEAIGISAPTYGGLVLAAWQGREDDYAELAGRAAADAARHGEGISPVISSLAATLLAIGHGRYEQALTAALECRRGAGPAELGTQTWVLTEIVEAGLRSDNHKAAAEAFEQLSEVTTPSGTDWALGIEARARALLSRGTTAEGCYREAIDRLGRTSVRGELARAHLLYGEWLRRERRRTQARAQLRTAHEMFRVMGMEAFADRAARELRATGETARRRTVETVGRLTPQETQIATLARDGLTNKEIAGRLYLSTRTVEYHLHKVFAKLGITSRNQLGRVL
ncbi:AAA family ATPase [Streptomyces sp. TRM S81-3]|uniref:AAA family ATPase n=1 Tax=Streptomyces griseicoloratus TaxID=2752516 RepID=A0A926QU45_9ACTN|nr:LuxR family transcriptional regulator [Streptomyces griseicoloratus]MBD0424734.1 AAA family ATPase [Streptomyces griseicoloratus]